MKGLGGAGMRPNLVWELAAIGMIAGIAASAELKYGEPYACGGERLVVSYCRGDSDAGAYVTNPLDNYCKVTYIDRPRVNGFLPETAELRGDILKKLAACSTAPGAAATAPKAPAGAKLQAADTNIVVPGTGNSKVTLLRLSHTTKGKRVFHYVDELSRKPTASPDVIAIWGLYVYPDGEPDSPGTRAKWIEFHMHCANGSFGLVTLARLDAEGRLLGAKQLSGNPLQVTKGSVGEHIFSIACKTAPAMSGSRFASAKAAIEDAMKPAPAAGTPAAAAQPARPAAAANPQEAAARADALIDAWTAAYNRGDHDGALASLREYTQLYPKDPTGYVLAGYTRVAKGDIDGAERVLLQGQRAAPEAPSIYVELGSLYQKHREDKPRALSMLRKAIALPAASMQDLVVAGELLWQAGEVKEATEAFRRAVQMSGDPRMLARGWVGFGRSQAKAMRFAQAETALKEAIRLDPKSADAHRALWIVHRDQGHAAAALAELEIVARLEPGDAWSQMWLGEAYAARKRNGEAAAAYDRAFALAPKDRLARDLLTLLSGEYEKIGRLDRAVETLRTSVATPHDGTTAGMEDKMMRDMSDCGELGRLLVAQKKYPDVVRLYLARGDCNGYGDSLGAGSLGIAYLRLGQAAKAIPLLEDKLEDVELSIKQYEAELADTKLAQADRRIKVKVLAEYRAEAVLELDALARAYLASGRTADAQRIARILQKYDATLATRLASAIAASAP